MPWRYEKQIFFYSDGTKNPRLLHLLVTIYVRILYTKKTLKNILLLLANSDEQNSGFLHLLQVYMPKRHSNKIFYYFKQIQMKKNLE